MKRTTTRRERELKHFIADNRRLFPLAGLFLLGVGVGVAVYLAATPPEHLLAVAPVAAGKFGWLLTLWNSLFATLLMLAALYLLGMWGCGAPFILAVPVWHGLGVGLTEAHYYHLGGGGVLTAATLVMPVGLLGGVVLVMAGAESLRLSLQMSRQLLPGGEGGLWHGFRLYSLRFLLFLAAAIAVSLLDVLLRALLPSLL